MICPDLEFLQSGGGLDAPDGAVTGIEIDEVRGGLRAELSRRAEPGRGVGDSGGLGADLPALAGSLSGGGGGGFVRPAPGPGFGRRVGVDEVLDVLALFDTRYWDFTAKHFWEKSGGRARGHAQLQLAAHDLAGARADQAGAAARGAPTQAAAPAGGGHDVAPGRLQPRMGGGRDVGPGGDLWTMRPARSTRAFSSPRKAL